MAKREVAKTQENIEKNRPLRELNPKEVDQVAGGVAERGGDVVEREDLGW